MAKISITEEKLEKIIADIFYSSSYLFTGNTKIIPANRNLAIQLTQNPGKWKAYMGLLLNDLVDFNFKDIDSDKTSDSMEKSAKAIAKQFITVIKNNNG